MENEILILNKSLNVAEIYYTIQGESSRAGEPCVIARLQGCNLRCDWCDTVFAQEINRRANVWTIEAVIEKIKEHSCKYVLITGGEPLLQTNVLDLIESLCSRGFEVAIETNGSLDIGEIDDRASIIMDMKTPSSKWSVMNNIENIEKLRKKDEVKFVIKNRDDYLWAKEAVEKYNLLEICGCVLFSPEINSMKPDELAKLILADRLPVRLQPQLHKQIWSGKEGV